MRCLPAARTARRDTDLTPSRPTAAGPPSRRAPGLGRLGAVLVAATLSVAIGWATPALADTPSPSTTAPPATTAPTIPSPAGTPTTLVPIGNHLPTPPATLPLATKPERAHVSPWLAKLSLAGFALFLAMLIVQAVLTSSRRRGGWTL